MNGKHPYTIKRYDGGQSGNFKCGSDKNVITPLLNEVNMVTKQSFKEPTRESIATKNPRRSSIRRRLQKEEIIDSPY